jgi:hypothetical protein
MIFDEFRVVVAEQTLSRVLCAMGIASFRPVPAIMRKPRARSRILKKFPRPPGRDRAGIARFRRYVGYVICPTSDRDGEGGTKTIRRRLGTQIWFLTNPDWLDDYHSPRYQRFHLFKLLQMPPDRV